MKAAVVKQEGSFAGIFSSNISVDKGSFQLFSAGVSVPGNNNTKDGSLLLLAGHTKHNKSFAPRFAVHHSDTWYHVGLVFDGAKLTTTISSENGRLGDLVDGVAMSCDVELKNFVFGVNRGLNQGYGYELANVKIYDSPTPLKPLHKEGKGAGYVDIPEPANYTLILGVVCLSVRLLRRRARA